MSSLCIPIALEVHDVQKLEKLIERGHRLERGDVLYRQSATFSCLYAVRVGSIKTVRLTESGVEQITGFYLPGEVFGLDGMADGQYANTAVALESSAVCAIPFEDLGRLSASLPSLQRHLFELMGQEIIEDQNLITLLTKYSAEQRMASFFLSLSKRYAQRGESDKRIRLSMSRVDIANYLGLTPETVSRVLAGLTKRGLIATEHKDVTLLDSEALRALLM